MVGLFRILLGFAVACLAAGVVKVAFAVTPAELAEASSDRLWQAGEWALMAATESAVFSAPFAFIAIVLAEWIGIRSFAYHGLVGILIAGAGFAVLLSGESPETAGLANSYAIAAFLSTGLIAGVVYWLFSGRLSGGRRITRRRQAQLASDPATIEERTAATSPRTGLTGKASVPAAGKIETATAGTRPSSAGAGRA